MSTRKAIVWALALFASACQFENTGSVRKSPEVAQAFETLQLQAFPGYRYYFLNQENNPFGVAGVESDYRMQGPDWKECDPDSPTFRKVVGLVQSFPGPGQPDRRILHHRSPRPPDRGLVLQSHGRDHGRPGLQEGYDRDRNPLASAMRTS